MFTEITIEEATKTLEGGIIDELLGVEQKIMVTDDRNEDSYFIKQNGSWFLKFPFFRRMQISEAWASAVFECCDEQREFYYI